MYVSGLYVYPIKSLGGIRLEKSFVTQRGLEYDRRYMLVDAEGIFITQRTTHQLALFKLSFSENGFTIDYKGDRMNIPFRMTGQKIRVKVWDDELNAVEAGAVCNEWFSKHLGFSVKLVYMGADDIRSVDSKYVPVPGEVSFADAYPVLMISQASLDMLNSRLDKPLDMDRFRPNIVITGSEPHAEDHFNEFKTGTAMFKGVKPCARCVVTTLNQQTLELGKEPLATLAKYRTNNNKILFGENLICKAEGTIAIGDELLFQ